MNCRPSLIQTMLSKISSTRIQGLRLTDLIVSSSSANESLPTFIATYITCDISVVPPPAVDNLNRIRVVVQKNLPSLKASHSLKIDLSYMSVISNGISLSWQAHYKLVAKNRGHTTKATALVKSGSSSPSVQPDATFGSKGPAERQNLSSPLDLDSTKAISSPPPNNQIPLQTKSCNASKSYPSSSTYLRNIPSNLSVKISDRQPVLARNKTATGSSYPVPQPSMMVPNRRRMPRPMSTQPQKNYFFCRRRHESKRRKTVLQDLVRTEQMNSVKHQDTKELNIPADVETTPPSKPFPYQPFVKSKTLNPSESNHSVDPAILLNEKSDNSDLQVARPAHLPERYSAVQPPSSVKFSHIKSISYLSIDEIYAIYDIATCPGVKDYCGNRRSLPESINIAFRLGLTPGINCKELLEYILEIRSISVEFLQSFSRIRPSVLCNTSPTFAHILCSH